MNITIICTLYPPYILGGAELSVSYLAKGLVKEGHHVSVITTGDKYQEETIDGVKVYRLKNKNIYWRYPQREKNILRKSVWHLFDIYNVLYKRDIKRILRKEETDVVNTSNLCGISVVAWQTAKELGIPIAHTLRDYYLLCPQQTMIKGGKSCERQCTVCRSYSWYKKSMSQNVDAVVGISDFILQHHLRFGYFKNSSLQVVIPNSVNKVEFTQRKKTNKIGFIGRLSPEKGIELMIGSFNDSKHEGYQLVIAGNGNANYEKALRDCYESDDVHFMGKMKQKDFFESIDLLIVPSLWNEPFGRVVIEAYSYHCPVLMAKNGGLNELVYNGVSCGFNTSSKDELTTLISKFCSGELVFNDSLYEAIMENYSEHAIVSQYVKLFNKLYEK